MNRAFDFVRDLIAQIRIFTLGSYLMLSKLCGLHDWANDLKARRGHSKVGIALCSSRFTLAVILRLSSSLVPYSVDPRSAETCTDHSLSDD